MMIIKLIIHPYKGELSCCRQIMLAHKEDLLKYDKAPYATKALSKSIKDLMNWMNRELFFMSDAKTC